MTSAATTDTASVAHAAALDILSSDEYSKYLLQTRNEMLPVLRGLTDAVAQVTMFFNEGKDMVLTSVVRHDNTALVLDFGPSAEMNRKALDAEKLFCVTQLDKVKIQFVLRRLTRIEDGGRPAFRAALPENMLRLQRREFFRLILPLTRPLKCTLPVELAGGRKLAVEAQIADISGGGVGLVGLPNDLPLEPRQELGSVTIELPEVGIVSAKLRVCSVTPMTNRSGIKSQRAGCEFVSLPGPMMTLIQRYIIKVERERKARESGMS